MAVQERFLGLSSAEISILGGIVSYANQQTEKLIKQPMSEECVQLIQRYERIRDRALSLLMYFPKVRIDVTSD